MPGACHVSLQGRGNLIDCRRASSLQKTTVELNGDNNKVVFSPGAHVHGCRVVVRGSNNRVEIDASTLCGVGVAISGDDNRIHIAEGCNVRSLGMVCEDSGNSVSIGTSTEIAGSTELAAIEGTRISIGAHCLFSGGIHFRTGDSHSIVDLEGRRLNASQDIAIGDHVWVGMNVLVLKGVRVSDSCVIGAGSVVTRSFELNNCVIGGNPAQGIREGIDWRVERIAYSE